MMPSVGAIFFIPLHHHAAGHGGGLERDRRSRAVPGRSTMPPGVLAEVARQVLHGTYRLENLRMRGLIEVESGIVKAGGRACRSDPSIPRWQHAAEIWLSVSGSKPSALPTSRAAVRPR